VCLLGRNGSVPVRDHRLRGVRRTGAGGCPGDDVGLPHRGPDDGLSSRGAANVAGPSLDGVEFRQDRRSDVYRPATEGSQHSSSPSSVPSFLGSHGKRVDGSAVGAG